MTADGLEGGCAVYGGERPPLDGLGRPRVLPLAAVSKEQSQSAEVLTFTPSTDLFTPTNTGACGYGINMEGLHVSCEHPSRRVNAVRVKLKTCNLAAVDHLSTERYTDPLRGPRMAVVGAGALTPKISQIGQIGVRGRLPRTLW